ncbi:hypothetical protein FACS1894141_5970 [Spirochaetia bacterium]|nr:hypothetical protein FACS1894141_5970 [Spirochaetia bacterium]
MQIHNPPAGIACWESCHFIANHAIDEMAAPFFRTKVVLPEEVVSAVVYLCGVGFHELSINGEKAGDSFLTPAQSIYDRRVYYNTYDIGSLLVRGENTIVTILGNGFYNCDNLTWNNDKAPWRHWPKMALFGDILLKDGKRVQVHSDSSFETGASAITYNSFYGGETMDYTRGPSLEAPAGAAVQPAIIVRGPGGILTPFPEPHVKEHITYTPVRITEQGEGKTLFDFGQNMAGWVRLDARTGETTRFTMRYGEALNADGALDTARIDCFAQGGRFQTDEYILDAEHPVIDGRPHFTYHGFRYVELTVAEGTLKDIALRAVTLNSDLKRIGAFSSSDDYVNRINDIGQKATLSNLVNVPTDCPHREKNGWTGDAALSAEQMCLNLDMREFFRRWLQDIRDSQRPSGQLPGIIPTGGWGFNWGSGPVWDSALFELPLAVYTCYGDSSLLLENRGAMKQYLEYCASMAEDHVLNFGLGDWCPPEGFPDARRLPETVSDTATYFKLAQILALASGLAGEKIDRCYYEGLAEKIKDAFIRHFVDRSTGVVHGDCQAGQGMALSLGLLDGETEKKAAAHLAALVEKNAGRLDFGILGAKYVFEALSRNGQGQLALDIILKEGYPSYRHWLDTGATTMSESWNRTASDNHHMFSDVCRWFYRYIAGLGRPDFQNRTITFTPENSIISHITPNVTAKVNENSATSSGLISMLYL